MLACTAEIGCRGIKGKREIKLGTFTVLSVRDFGGLDLDGSSVGDEKW